MSNARELKQVAATFSSLAVKTPSIEAPILSLSGGNQQKVVMSRALLAGPDLIVADEPTQGVDVGARAEIYRILREVSSSGTPVIVNSSDAAELEGLCDKVIVLSRGRAVATLTGADVSEARIVAAAVGATAHVADRRSARTGPLRCGGLPAFFAIRQCPGRSLGARDHPARALRLQPERQFPVIVQSQQHPVACDRFGLYCARPDHHAVARRHRPFGRPALGISGRRRVVLHQRRQIRADDRRGLRADVLRRLCRRRNQRHPYSFCEFHADRGDARHVHRPARHELFASREPGRLHQRRRRAGHHLAVRPHPSGIHCLGRCRHRQRIRFAKDTAWLAAARHRLE